MPQETQADREAAKSLEDSLGFLTHDEMPLVIAALAAHREQAVKPLVEALEAAEDALAEHCPGLTYLLDTIIGPTLAKARDETKENG